MPTAGSSGQIDGVADASATGQVDWRGCEIGASGRANEIEVVAQVEVDLSNSSENLRAGFLGKSQE